LKGSAQSPTMRSLMLASEVARETALLAVAAVLSVPPVRVILLGLSRPLPHWQAVAASGAFLGGRTSIDQNNPTRPAP
jgi:hypothetical protein